MVALRAPRNDDTRIFYAAGATARFQIAVAIQPVVTPMKPPAIMSLTKW